MTRRQLILTITWKGPYKPRDVIEQLGAGGTPPGYDGEDYGLYQIYGKHILEGDDALLYIGQAIKRTFSRRMKDHEEWLQAEEQPAIYVGRVYHPDRHNERDEWASWESDVDLIERILIYKYSPHYNSRSVTEPPTLNGFGKVVLRHLGKRHQLKRRDIAPDDL